MFTSTVYEGGGSHWLVAFYGFGQSARIYEPLYELIKDTHNLLVIDLPSRAYEQDYQPKDFEEYVLPLFKEKGITSFQTVSFSMGSRMNLFMPSISNNSLTKMILVAPDGIKINIWNRMAVHTWLGHKLFQYFVKSEHAYLSLLRMLYKTKILNKGLYTFSKWNMRDTTQRTKVYNAWMNMRCMIPHLKEVNELIKENNTELITYFGKKDTVIPLHIYKKCKRVFSEGRHNLMDTDHNILNECFFTLLAEEIKI